MPAPVHAQTSITSKPTARRFNNQQSRPPPRSWQLVGQADLLWPVIVDRSPETDANLRYRISLSWNPHWHGLYARLWAGLQQRLVRLQGQSPVDPEDARLGLGYRRVLGLWDRTQASLQLHLYGLLPFSSASQANGLITAFEQQADLSWPLAPQLSAGLDLIGQYRIVRFREHHSDLLSSSYGFPGGNQTRVLALGGARLHWSPWSLASWGQWSLVGRLGYQFGLQYGANTSSSLSWSAGLHYSMPPTWRVTLALEHGYSPLQRGGLMRMNLFDRDETRLRLTVTGML